MDGSGQLGVRYLEIGLAERTRLRKRRAGAIGHFGVENCFLSLSLDIILYLLFFLDGVEPLIESAGLAEIPNSRLEIDVSEFRTSHGHIISISKSPSCLSWVGTG